MYTIGIFHDEDGHNLCLYLDGEEVDSWIFKEPVQVAFKVRHLVEEYL